MMCLRGALCLLLMLPLATGAAQTKDQTPRPPFPYEIREVEVAASETLACSLTLPSEGSDLPGVVLQTVAWANDRDQTHSGHKPYLVLADHLARAGIAALRCDDRGVGGSTGDLASATITELADDAMAMADYLSSIPRVGTVGIIGNSEGTVTDGIAAGNCGNAGFLVMLGGVGVKGAELIRYRQEAMGRANGLDDGSARIEPRVPDRTNRLDAGVWDAPRDLRSVCSGSDHRVDSRQVRESIGRDDQGQSNTEKVVRYLARYSHRIAISNQRIIGIDKDQVDFRYKDYRDDQSKVMKLHCDEFIRRFLMRVLPNGLMRIHHCGLLANRCRKASLKRIRKIPAQPAQAEEKPKLDAAGDYPSPKCHQGHLKPIRALNPLWSQLIIVPG